MKKTEQGTPPWGRWFVLDEGDNYKVKRIEVHPGNRFSYQRHTQRREHWMIVQGEGKVTLNEQEIPVKEWVSVDIPVQAAHRMENIGTETLIFIEVQQGDYLGEDDIIRLEDDYGRTG
jgi:mannose-6-phosphate isomerase